VTPATGSAVPVGVSGGGDVTSAVGSPATLDVAGGARTAGGRRSSPALGLALVLWDAALPAALVMIANGLESAPTAPWSGASGSGSGWLALLLGLLSPLGLAVAGGYRHRRRRTESRLLFAMRLLALGIVLSWISVVVAVLAGWPVGLAQVLVLPAGLWAGWLLGRWACDRHPAASRDRVLLVGSGAVAQRILTLTGRHRERRLHVVGRLDDEPLPMEEAPRHCSAASPTSRPCSSSRASTG
jgi:FlaA1/EpsC-like NDP-sugar epimerase